MPSVGLAGFAGGLIGASQGFNTVATENLRQMRDDELEQRHAKAELLKEQRIREYAKEDREFERKANREDKALERESDFKFKTDPNNVKALTDAELAKQSGLDKYKDSRLGADVEREGRLARAKHIEGPDRTDYEGRRLDHLYKRARIESEKRGNSKGYIKDLQEERDFLLEQRGQAEGGDVIAIDQQLREIEGELTRVATGQQEGEVARKNYHIEGLDEDNTDQEKPKEPEKEGFLDKAATKAKGFFSSAKETVGKALEEKTPDQMASEREERGKAINTAKDGIFSAVNSMRVLNTEAKQNWYESLSEEDQDKFDSLSAREQKIYLGRLGIN